MSEYAILTALIAVCAIAGISFLSAAVLDRFTEINLRLTNILPQRN